MEERYSGIDILKALEEAHLYNDYLTNLVRSASPAKAIIDFGAGVGTFSKRLREAGHQVLCIEPDVVQRQHLTEQGFETLSSLELVPDNSAQFIFSLNVFEHIEDDRQAIALIHQKLKAGGTLLIYVPAFQCLWSSLDDKVHHYRRYTKKSLRQLTEQAGFSVVKIGYADSLGFGAALVFRLLGRSASAINPESVAFYDRWIFRPSRFLDHAFHPFFGKNVYVICRKQGTA